MNTPDFLQPFLEYPNVIAQFIERIPTLPVSTNRSETIERLEPIHKKELNALGLEWGNLRRAQQIHGKKIALVGDIGSSYPVEGIDGLVCSGVSDAVLGIYVADCAAIWVYDTVTKGRLLLHSGKSGTEHNIVRAGIKAMIKFCKSDPINLIAVISPCIRPPYYEVDIAPAIIQQLIDEGVPENKIFDSGLNTAADLNRFYSYRAEKGNTGRMFAIFGGKH